MAEIRIKHAVVGIKELKQGMRILSFLDFTNKYHSTDETTCSWLKHNFRGTSASIIRGSDKRDILVDDMLPGDNLQKLYKLPDHLKKITQVSDRLVNELAKRGFTQFRVEMKVKAMSQGQEKRLLGMKEANDLSRKTKECEKTHDEASEAVENLLDNARQGSMNTAEVKHYVDNIIDGEKTAAIAAISSLKASDQTYAHCVEVSGIYMEVYFKAIAKMGASSLFADKKEAMLGAFLHDFGKSKVPKDVLDSTTRFDRGSKEMNLLQSHPTFGAEILKGLDMPSHIINMAHYHHVKLDPDMKSSYPRVDPKKVMMETHFLALVDIYQALVGKRKYKKAWSPAETIKYLDALAGIEYPMDLFGYFQSVIGRYPISSLVQLSDERKAFVMSVPEHDLDRPEVVVVKNAQGEMLTHHDFLDLSVEQDISIAKALDAQDEFGDDALQIFGNLHAA